jgi:phosphatidate cytidylyltransferase
MMNELIKRVLTSLFLVNILFFCLYYSGFYLLTFLTLFYLISNYELIRNTKNLLFLLISNFFIILALFSFYTLRGDSSTSLLLICWILSATFLSDIGGYFFGKTFKGKKLTKISPNKTYSGSIGSIFLSTTSLIFLELIKKFLFEENLINFYEFKYFFITILISIVCQLGDLYVSFWKRKIKIKNISNLLPGHGGVLDRVDGLIFVLIFCFIINKIGFI